MELAVTLLPYIHIGLSVLLVTSILLQRTGAGLGEAFGGGGSDIGFHTRRGLERLLFQVSITLSVLFVASILAALFLH
jgi:preprotein translocase subunit SecG